MMTCSASRKVNVWNENERELSILVTLHEETFSCFWLPCADRICCLGQLLAPGSNGRGVGGFTDSAAGCRVIESDKFSNAGLSRCEWCPDYPSRRFTLAMGRKDWGFSESADSSTGWNQLRLD